MDREMTFFCCFWCLLMWPLLWQLQDNVSRSKMNFSMKSFNTAMCSRVCNCSISCSKIKKN